MSRRGLAGLITLTAALTLGACGSSPQGVADDANPVAGQQSTSTPSTTESSTTEQTTEASPTTKKQSAAQTKKADSGIGKLDATGYGSIKLGMSKQAALATGMLQTTPLQPNPGGCADYPFPGNTGGVVSIDDSVMSISPPDGVKTAEGITIGSTYSQAKAAYPDLTDEHIPGFAESAKVPGNPDASFQFKFDSTQKVSTFSMIRENVPGCAFTGKR